MKTIHVQAGQPTKIIGKFSNSIATTYQFTATSESAIQSLSGTIDIRGSNWIFPKPATTQSLQVENTVSKSMWDTFFSVYVTSDQDVRITLENGQMNKSWVIIALAIGVTAAAASLVLVRLQ